MNVSSKISNQPGVDEMNVVRYINAKIVKYKTKSEESIRWSETDRKRLFCEEYNDCDQ